jgi:hypothetical protein
MMLFDLACPETRRLIDEAMPSPMAVPSLRAPVLVPAMALTSAALSVVSGISERLSPENTTRPMLSLVRWATNLEATSLAASIRLGSRSVASILLEMSSASTMSVPSMVDE